MDLVQPLRTSFDYFQSDSELTISGIVEITFH